MLGSNRNMGGLMEATYNLQPDQGDHSIPSKTLGGGASNGNLKNSGTRGELRSSVLSVHTLSACQRNPVIGLTVAEMRDET